MWSYVRSRAVKCQLVISHYLTIFSALQVAALWLQSIEHFDSEVKAYIHLHGLQGRSIPRLYALASFNLSSGGAHNIPKDLRHGPLSTYFEAKAILLEFLEYIPDPVLHDLPFSDLSFSPAGPTQTCQTIVQEAVDTVHEYVSRWETSHQYGCRSWRRRARLGYWCIVLGLRVLYKQHWGNSDCDDTAVLPRERHETTHHLSG